ncbi:MAG: type II secretion system F family protein [Lentisphaeria bacterium]|jgi:tight adherence protein B
MHSYVVIIGILAIGGSIFLLALLGMKIVFSRYDTYEELALRRINEKLDQVFLFMDPRKFYHYSLLLAVVVFLLGYALNAAKPLSGFVYGSILGYAAYNCPRLWIRIRLHNRTKALLEQLPEALDMLNSSMKAGLTLYQAIVRAAGILPHPIGQEFGVVAFECRMGTDIATAFVHMSERVNILDMKLISAATEISIKLGGNLSEAYEKISTLIRNRLMFEKEMIALTAEGNMQGVVMSILPFVVLVIMLLINRQLMLPFIMSKLGIFLLILVALMQVAAYFWIKKITSVEY